jgi:glycine/D-amino acid oxidase-like deaminating enzyme
MKHIYHESAFDTDIPVGSYWLESAGEPVATSDLAGEENAICDIAIIGAGYTGLSAAYHLCRDHGANVRVLDAAYPGFGGSGRNGGFAGYGGSKLSVGQTIKRVGMEETKRFSAWQADAIDLVDQILTEENIDADKVGSGEVGFAHKPSRVAGMREDVDYMNKTFDSGLRFMDRDECAEHGLAGPQVHAGVAIPKCFGIHPLKYCRGLARAAQSHGAVIHGEAPVTDWRKEGGLHVLVTPKGEVRAKQVIIGTNGYTAEDTNPGLAGRVMPALSNILITRPLSVEEQIAQGWTTHDITYDSRKLLHYVRLLPDGRFMFGGRGGWDASPAGKARMKQYMVKTFREMFPAWAHVDFTHFWNGFICMTYDLVAHVGHPLNDETVWSALAWHGSGVSAGTNAGRLAARLAAGAASIEHDVPHLMQGVPPKFPFPFLRTKYLHAAYLAYYVKDEWL